MNDIKFIQIFLLLGSFFLNNGCSTNNVSYSKSNSTIANCQSDSIASTVDTLMHNIDTKDILGVVHSVRDENNVWFDEQISSQLRIVFQSDKRSLLIYLDQKLLKKYINVVAIQTNYETYLCKDGQYIRLDNSSESISISNKQDDLIIEINQGRLNPQNYSIIYYYNKSSKFKGITNNINYLGLGI